MSTAQYSFAEIYQMPSAARERRKPLAFPTAGRLGSLRRIAGLLLAALLCLLTGKAPLQTFADDPKDERVTQDDDRDESKSAIPETRELERAEKRKTQRRKEDAAPWAEEERRIEERRIAPAAADAALVDTAPWKQFREANGICGAFCGKPEAIPFPPHPGMQTEPQKVISQEDLSELDLLKKRVREAKKCYEKKRTRIRGAMASGASIEAGVRSVAMKTREVLVVQ
jgi:hypothetical protein